MKMFILLCCLTLTSVVNAASVKRDSHPNLVSFLHNVWEVLNDEGDCQPGQMVTDEGCVNCPAGSYSDAVNATSCSPCAAGTYQDQEGQAACSACAAGTFQDQEGQTSCSDCAAGSYQDQEGQATCSACAAGTFQDQEGQTSCSNCAAGSFQDQEGQTSCSNCAAGTAQDQEGQTSCSNCAAGTAQDQEGQTSCSACAPGSFQDQEGQTSCSDCAAGSYQDQEGQTCCSACAAGTFQDQEGQTSCSSCAAGTAQDQEGQTSCSNCAAGTYQDQEGQATCSACAAGSFQDSEGQVSCNDCSAGSYQDKEGQTSCTLCSKGSYQDQTGSPSCNKCRDEKTYTTYMEGSTSADDCQGPLLRFTKGKEEPQFMTDTGKVSVGTTSHSLSFFAVSGNWALRHPEDPYREYFVIQQGDKEIKLDTSVPEWILEPVIGNLFCYVESEGNGKYFNGYQTKDAQGRPCDDEQYCRNSDSLDIGPHCMVNNEPSACGIPKCVWDVQCYAGDGIGYRGSVNAATSKGKTITCQAWNKDWPHVHPEFHPSTHNTAAYGIGNHNLCRNPDPKNTNKPWCYTTDFWTRWASCDVPQCDDSVPYFTQE